MKIDRNFPFCHPELVPGSLLPGFYFYDEMPKQVLHENNQPIRP